MSKSAAVLVLFVVALFAFAPSADASPIMTGDVFRITFTDTSATATAFLDSDPSLTETISNPDFGAVTSADFTLGASVGPGIFSISDITNLVGTPPFLTVDFSNMFFDASLLGLTGTISDTYLGGGGGTHADVLTAFAPPSLGAPGTWTLSDDHLSAPDPFTIVTAGTYVATPVATPEPSTLLLCSSGVFAALARRRTKRETLTRR